MKRCPNFQMMAAFADHNLSEMEKDELELHLLYCKPCRDVMFSCTEKDLTQQAHSQVSSQCIKSLLNLRPRSNPLSLIMDSFIIPATAAAMILIAAFIGYRAGQGSLMNPYAGTVFSDAAFLLEGPIR